MRFDGELRLPRGDPKDMSNFGIRWRSGGQVASVREKTVGVAIQLEIDVLKHGIIVGSSPYKKPRLNR